MKRSQSDLDRLLSTAGDELDRRIERQRSTTAPTRWHDRPERRARLVLAAAAMVATVAGVAIVAARSSTPKSITSSTPTTASSLAESTSTVPVSTIPQPARVAIFDPQLGLGEPSRPDPAFTWVHTEEVADQWFVRRSASGEPVAGLLVAHLAASEWDKSFSDGTPIDIGASIEARVMAGTARPVIGWRTSEGVIDVSGVGDADLIDITTAARVVAAATSGSTAQIDGFELVPTPVTGSVVSYENGLSLTMNQLPGLDARTLAFFHGTSAQANESIWVADVEGATVAYADLNSEVQVVSYIPDELTADVASLIASVQLVDPESVAIRSYPSSAPPDAPYDTGVTTAGRWLLATWTDELGQGCFRLDTSFAGGAGGCDPAGTTRTCWSLIGWGVDTGAYFAVLVEGEAQTMAAIVDGAETSAVLVDQGERYTLGVGYPAAEVQQTISFVVDGRTTTC